MCRIGFNAEMVKKLLRMKIVASLTPHYSFFSLVNLFLRTFTSFSLCRLMCSCSACAFLYVLPLVILLFYEVRKHGTCTLSLCVCARGRVVFKHGTCMLSVCVCEGELFFAPALVSSKNGIELKRWLELYTEIFVDACQLLPPQTM